MLRRGAWTLARLAVIGLLVVGYAHFWGLALGWPPFTPKWMWNQSGEWVYPLTVAGQADAIKVVVGGYLSQGSLRFELRRGSRVVGRGSYQAGPIDKEYRYLAASGAYTLVIFTEKATGRVLYDAVATRFEQFR